MNIKRKFKKACSNRPRHFNNNNVEKCSEWQDQVSIKSASYDRLIISTAKQLFACLLININDGQTLWNKIYEQVGMKNERCGCAKSFFNRKFRYSFI